MRKISYRKALQFSHQFPHQFAHQLYRRPRYKSYGDVDEQIDEEIDEEIEELFDTKFYACTYLLPNRFFRILFVFRSGFDTVNLYGSIYLLHVRTHTYYRTVFFAF